MPIVTLGTTKKENEEERSFKPELASDEAEDDIKDEEKDEKKDNQRQERTFVSFSDEDTLKQSFPSRGFRLPATKICPITRLPAKYFDPVTELPYANLQVCKKLGWCCVVDPNTFGSGSWILDPDHWPDPNPVTVYYKFWNKNVKIILEKNNLLKFFFLI